MVASSGISTINNVGTGSGNGAGILVKRTNQKPEESSPVTNVPSSKIKYRKIKKHDKFLVKGNLPEFYISDIKVPKTDIKKLMQVSAKYRFVSLRVFNDENEHYVNSCYIVDSLVSPVPYKGEGTKAIKSLVEKSLSDKETEGRILIDVKKIGGESSGAGFFYKLGFRFVEDTKNHVMEDWYKNQKNKFSPNLVGIMYLPQDKMKKLMMYNMLL